MPKNLTLIPFSLPGKIYRAPMPFGSFDEGVSTMNEMIKAGVTTVFTLVETFEWEKYANCDLQACYQKAGIKMIHYPITDFEAPQDPQVFLAFVQQAVDLLKQGEILAVHCFAGIGRTGTFLAGMARYHFGYGAEEAIQWIRQYIPNALENEKQTAFMKTWEI